MDDSATIEIWGAGTMRTFRPVWTAEELGLNYRHVPIGPRTGETQTEEYIRLNPKQKVPCLVDGELVFSESVAISRYLIARYGDRSTITAPAPWNAWGSVKKRFAPVTSASSTSRSAVSAKPGRMPISAFTIP